MSSSMSFNVWNVTLFQVCIGSYSRIPHDFDVTKDSIRNDISGVGDQFVDDIMVVYEKYQRDLQASHSIKRLVSEIYNLNLSHETWVLWKLDLI